MAEGGISEIESGGDEIFDFLCSVCKAQNKNTEADKFCFKCHYYYCSSCVKCHDIVPALKDHKILDTAQSHLGSTAQLPAVPTEKCKLHKHKPMDMYCNNHDVVECSVCMQVKHSSCNRTFYVSDYVEDNSEAANSKNIEEHLDSVIQSLNKLQQDFIKEKEELKSNKDETLKEIRQFKEKINQIIDQFEENTVHQLEQKFQAQLDNINSGLRELGALIEEVKTAQDSMKSAKSATRNKPQLFVSIKQANEIASQAMMQAIITKNQLSQTAIYYLVNEKLQDLFNEMKDLGSIRLVKQIQVTDEKKYPVNVKSDLRACDIISGCEFENGTIILSDRNNNKLKSLDSTSYAVIDCCDVSEYPAQVCAISYTEIAVCCYNSALIQFVNVGSRMKKTRQITTGFWCYGLAYGNERLFVSSTSSVYVFSLSGKQLQKLYYDQSVQRLFSDITALAVNSDKSRIYVTDSVKGLIILDMNGQLVGQYNGDKLRGAYGVCLDNDDNVLVCGSRSGNVLQFSPNGKLIGEVLKTDRFCNFLCMKKNKSNLIVSFSDNINSGQNDIEVYSINE